MPRAIVVLTRETPDNARLAASLRERDLDVREVPCLSAERVGDLAPIADRVRRLTRDDLILVVSRHAAAALLAALPASEIRAPVLAIGEASASPLRDAGLDVRVAAARGAQAVAREVALPHGRILQLQSDLSPSEPAEILRSRGATVESVVAYRTVPGVRGGDVAALRADLWRGPLVVFASPSAVDGMLAALSPAELARARVVAIGPTTAARVRERAGVEPTVAHQATDDALLGAIERALKEVPDVARA